MGSIVFSFLWLGVSVGSMFVVARNVEARRDRIAYYLLIWLIPFIGAAAAALLTRQRASTKSSSEKMFDAVVDAHRHDDSI